MLFKTSLTRSFAGILLASSLVLGTATVSHGQATPPKKELSDKVSTELGAKLKILTDAENWSGALTVLDGLISSAPANSYDMLVISQLKAQMLLRMERFADAIGPLATTLELGDRNPGFLDERQSNDILYYLAQLHFQVAQDIKDKALQRKEFGKALHYIERKIKVDPKIKTDHLVFAASLLFTMAQAETPNAANDNADKEYLIRAKDMISQALILDINPKKNVYVLMLACLQQLGEIEKSASYLELLLRDDPDNKTYWGQLFGSYLNLASVAKNQDEVVSYNIRALTAIDRAQQYGFLNSPKENYNRVGILFNLQFYDQAIEVLEAGLRDGSIENSMENWLLLSGSYQQVNKEFKAIATIKDALKSFPEAGNLEFQIANIYYGMNDVGPALEHASRAIERGNLDKPWQVQLFAAYMAYELKKYEQALSFAKAAGEFDEATAAPRLIKAIQDAITEREEFLNQKA